MSSVTAVLISILAVVVLLALVAWIGLRISPQNLSIPERKAQPVEAIAVPDDVPAPVARYYAVALGDSVPRMESMAAYGRARANFGLWMPLRYRLVHDPGRAFERYMEVTWFGVPVLKAVDRYVDGRGMTGPMGREATGPEVDQGANMILWAEAPLMPALWIMDGRVRWEAIDDSSARLFFPLELSGEKGEDELIVHFDADTGLISRMSALRYRDAASGKIPWHVEFERWQTVEGLQVPARLSITWEDQGKPWSYWEVDEILWNVDLAATGSDLNRPPVTETRPQP